MCTVFFLFVFKLKAFLGQISVIRLNMEYILRTLLANTPTVRSHMITEMEYLAVVLDSFLDIFVVYSLTFDAIKKFSICSHYLDNMCSVCTLTEAESSPYDTSD